MDDQLNYEARMEDNFWRRVDDRGDDSNGLKTRRRKIEVEVVDEQD